MTPAPVYRGLLVPSRIMGLTPLGFMLAIALTLQMTLLSGQFMAVLVLAGTAFAIMGTASRSHPDVLEGLRAALRHRRDYRI